MIGWLANQFSPAREAAGALASSKAVRTLIAKLESETPQYAVETLTTRLRDIPREWLATPDGSHALQQLDEWAQRPVNDLWQSLLADSQGQTASEAICSALTHYYRRSFARYQDCLEAHSASGPLAKQERTDAILIAARALAAFARYILLLRLRYLSVPDESWSRLWGLAGWVERCGGAEEQLALYPGAETNTTLQGELLTALLIEVAPTPNLLPGQLLALEQLLRLNASHYRISDKFDAQATPFAYDPLRHAAPDRWLKADKLRPGVRFFGLGNAYTELCNAREDAHSSRNRPRWLERTRCSVQSYTDLLDLIVAHWSLEPPRRQHRREPRNDEILVARNFHAIRCLVRFSELAISGRSLAYDSSGPHRFGNTIRSLADKASSSPGAQTMTPQEALSNLQTFEKMLGDDVTEPWNMTDFSASGLGATAESDCAWAMVGMLVAYRRRESVNWHLALIRRLRRSTHGALYIGMARIRARVSSGALRSGTDLKDYTRTTLGGGGAADIEYDALLLQDAAPALLLPVGIFDLTHKYTLSCEERQQVITMKRSVERGPNFERIEFAEVDMVRAA